MHLAIAVEYHPAVDGYGGGADITADLSRSVDLNPLSGLHPAIDLAANDGHPHLDVGFYNGILTDDDRSFRTDQFTFYTAVDADGLVKRQRPLDLRHLGRGTAQSVDKLLVVVEEVELKQSMQLE